MSRKRQALLALLVTAPAPSIGALIAFHVAPGTAGQAAYALGKAVLYGMPLVWLRFVAREPIRLSPLRKGGLGAGALSGAVLGCLVYAAFLASSPDAGALREAVTKAGIGSRGAYIGFALWLCLVNALLEEYAFRWFLYARCRDVVVGGPAVLLAALVFTAHHVIVLRAFFAWGLVLAAASGVFAGGLVWTVCYRRYGSIWPGYVSHVVVDLAILAIGWRMLAL